jgi:predicted dehydrogenase
MKNIVVKKESSGISRRTFVRRVGAVGTFTLLPSPVIFGAGSSPNEKLNLAFIGINGRGGANLDGLGNQNVVALCDVDIQRSEGVRKKFPQAKFYKDFRKMFDEMEKSFDGVVISTPDHTHTVAAMAAMKRGKHVYCEKPLAHNINEVRTLMDAAKKYNVITQLGNQGHSFDTIRTFYEWINDGAIGKVHTIHAFASAKYSRIDQLSVLNEQHPVPDWLDWDLWLGPVNYRPYNPAYLPGKCGDGAHLALE